MTITTSPERDQILLRAPQEARDRFWSQIDVQPNGCWNRTGCAPGSGYTRVTLERRSIFGHRAAYTWAKGPIPPGLVIDHLCRNRRCVNPAHLEAVTNDENMARGMRPNKTHCNYGHEYTDANTIWVKNNRNPPYRECRQCRLRYKRELRERKRANTATLTEDAT